MKSISVSSGECYGTVTEFDHLMILNIHTVLCWSCSCCETDTLCLWKSHIWRRNEVKTFKDICTFETFGKIRPWNTKTGDRLAETHRLCPTGAVHWWSGATHSAQWWTGESCCANRQRQKRTHNWQWHRNVRFTDASTTTYNIYAIRRSRRSLPSVAASAAAVDETDRSGTDGERRRPISDCRPPRFIG